MVLVKVGARSWSSEQKEKSGLFTSALTCKGCEWWRTLFVRDCQFGQVKSGGLAAQRRVGEDAHAQVLSQCNKANLVPVCD